MWPDVSELDADERCDTPLALASGRPAQLYSAFHSKTVDRHFQWMEDYELPGVFLQRFSVSLERPAVIGFRDAVALNVRAAAEAHGRVFALMYDISGHPQETVVQSVKRDWVHVVDTLRLTESPRYLRHRGRPLLAIWGFGFTDRAITPAQAAELIDFFQNNPDPAVSRHAARRRPGALAYPHPRLADRSRRGHASIDPSTSSARGRSDAFATRESIDRFYESEVRGDRAETQRLGIDYLPVVFPGFSWHNMNPTAAFNRIPRLGGRFYWRQVGRALQAGTTMLYGAMFDEVDEGTAMFKLAAPAATRLRGVPIVTLDADGESLPSDWYLRLARETQRGLSRAVQLR